MAQAPCARRERRASPSPELPPEQRAAVDQPRPDDGLQLQAATHCIDWDILNTKHRTSIKEEDLQANRSKVMAERGLRSVILIGGGEPTLYPGFVDFVASSKELELDGRDRQQRQPGRPAARGGADAHGREGLDPPVPRLGARTSCSRPCTGRTTRRVTWTRSAPGCRSLRRRPTRSRRLGFSYIIVWAGRGAGRRGRCTRTSTRSLAREPGQGQRLRLHLVQAVLERQEDGAEVMDPRAPPRRTTPMWRPHPRPDAQGAWPRRAPRGRPLPGATRAPTCAMLESTATLEEVHPPAEDLPHAGAAPGAHPHRPLQLPRPPRRGEGRASAGQGRLGRPSDGAREATPRASGGKMLDRV